MGSKRTLVDVFPLKGLAMALVITSARSGETSKTAGDAPSGYDDHAQPSNAWLHRKLSRRQIHGQPSAYHLQDDLCRRSLCVL
jgi:hypothetical protein